MKYDSNDSLSLFFIFILDINHFLYYIEINDI